MVPSEKPGLVFQRRGRQRSDDHCPRCVVCPRSGTVSVGVGGHTRRKLFSSHLTRGVVSEVRESSRALRRVFPNTHAPKGEKRRVLARWTKTTFTPLHFFFSFLPPKNKRFQTNGIRPGLNSDGVYTFHPI